MCNEEKLRVTVREKHDYAVFSPQTSPSNWLLTGVVGWMFCIAVSNKNSHSSKLVPNS